MKDRQFSIMNNGGGRNRRRLCRMYKRSLAVVSALTVLFTTSAVMPCSNFSLTGGITASAEETKYIDGHYMDFGEEASKGNWKEDATLDKDGYHWDAGTKTLTLGNIQINPDSNGVCLDFPSVECTIVIAEGAEPIISGRICKYILTVTGKGTLTASGIMSNNKDNKDKLTIKGGAEVIVRKADGDITINEGGKLDVSVYIDTPKITMDETAVLEINTDTEISCTAEDNNLEESLKAIEDYFPSGYKLEIYQDEWISYDMYFIIPDNASVKYGVDEDGDETYFPQYEDGTPVRERVLIKYSPHPDNIGEHLAGHSVSLDGNIGVNFYMELDERVIADKNARMQFTLPDGNVQTVTVGEAKTAEAGGKNYYVFSCNVAPKDFADKITAQIITSDNIKGTLYEYSVLQYIDYIFMNSENYDEKTLNLVDAMMGYCRTAREYFSPVDEKPADESPEIPADDLVEFKKQTSGTLPEGIEYYGSSLLLESNTVIRHYFRVAEGTDVSAYGFREKNGYWYKDITNISALKLGILQKTTIGDWSILYCPMSYVYSVLASDSADKNLVNLCKALYLYGKSAEEYQNK